MTTPSEEARERAQELLKATEADPQLREELQRLVLTGALMALPALVGHPAGTDPGTVMGRLEGLDGRMGQVEDRMESLEVRMEGVEVRMEGVEVHMEGVENRMEGVENRLSAVEVQVTRTGSQVSNLVGDDYERQAALRGYRRVRDSLGLERVTLVYHGHRQGEDEFNQLVIPALEQGALSEQDVDELVETDLIFRGRRPTAPDRPDTPDTGKERLVHVAVEASVTVQAHDVERARRRAQLLQAIPGVQAAAAVMGTAITAEALAALQDDVHPVAMTEDGQPAELQDAGSETGEGWELFNLADR